MATAMTWDDWIRRHYKALTLGSHGHELKFVQKVLSQVNCLSPESVTHQVAFKDAQGGNRRIDFVIQDGGVHRSIAIEIDGRDKTGKLPTHEEHNDFLTRQNALMAAGYTLVRHTNNQVKHEADKLIAGIENVIVKERAEFLRLERLAADTAKDVASKVVVGALDAAVVDAATRVAGVEAARVGEAVATAAAQRYLEEHVRSTPSADNRIKISMDDITPPSPARPAAAVSVAPKSSSNGGVIAAVIAVAVVVILLIALSGGGGSNGGGSGGGDGNSQVDTPSLTDPGITLTPTLDSSGVAPSSYQTCPADYPLKGNQTGIYHSPGQQYYDKTNPEQCFATPADAERAGYRASKV